MRTSCTQTRRRRAVAGVLYCCRVGSLPMPTTITLTARTLAMVMSMPVLLLLLLLLLPLPLLPPPQPRPLLHRLPHVLLCPRPKPPWSITRCRSIHFPTLHAAGQGGPSRLLSSVLCTHWSRFRRSITRLRRGRGGWRQLVCAYRRTCGRGPIRAPGQLCPICQAGTWGTDSYEYVWRHWAFLRSRSRTYLRSSGLCNVRISFILARL